MPYQLRDMYLKAMNTLLKCCKNIDTRRGQVCDVLLIKALLKLQYVENTKGFALIDLFIQKYL
jgi:hypothetical protein